MGHTFISSAALTESVVVLWCRPADPDLVLAVVLAAKGDRSVGAAKHDGFALGFQCVDERIGDVHVRRTGAGWEDVRSGSLISKLASSTNKVVNVRVISRHR